MYLQRINKSNHKTNLQYKIMCMCVLWSRHGIHWASLNDASLPGRRHWTLTTNAASHRTFTGTVAAWSEQRPWLLEMKRHNRLLKPAHWRVTLLWLCQYSQVFCMQPEPPKCLQIASEIQTRWLFTKVQGFPCSCPTSSPARHRVKFSSSGGLYIPLECAPPIPRTNEK